VGDGRIGESAHVRALLLTPILTPIVLDRFASALADAPWPRATPQQRV
jgi:hypothetical protein